MAHPEGKPRHVGGGMPGNQNARKHGLYSAYVPVVALKQALDLPPGDLRLEIAALRALLAEAMQSELPSVELLKAVEAGMTTLARLLRTNKQLDNSGKEKLDEEVDRALEELGLGET